MKRFTGTEKWSKEWFQHLKPKLKCLWNFVCDNADACGVWESNFGLASYQIGEKVSEVDFAAFGGRIYKLASGKFLIPSFIGFQYGKLSQACPAHKPVFRAMERNRVTDTLLNRLLSSLQEEEEDKEEEEETDKEGEEMQEEGAQEPQKSAGGAGVAEEVYAAYPKKAGKQEALRQIRVALKSIPGERLLDRTRAYAVAVGRWPDSERRFIPHPERWFKKGCWDDDPQTWEPQKTAVVGALDKSKTIGLRPEEMPPVWRPE